MKKEFLVVLKKVDSEMPVIGKNKSVDFNSTHFKYAPLEKVWAEVSSVLRKNGFVITNDITLEGVRTTATHELGELTSITPFSNTISRPQERGAEITYYRRYNLTAMFNIIVVGEDNELLLLQNKEVKKPNKTVTPEDITKEMYERSSSVQQEKLRTYYAKKNGKETLTKVDFYLLKNWTDENI